MPQTKLSTAAEPKKTVKDAKTPAEPKAPKVAKVAKPAKAATKPAKSAAKPAVKSASRPAKKAAPKPKKEAFPDIETRLEQDARTDAENTQLSHTVAELCALISSKKAEGIKVIRIGQMSSIADYFIICSGRNVTQVKAIYEILDEKCQELNLTIKRSEGEKEGRWIAVDFGEIVAHIFHSEAREFYQLDKLWSNGTNVVEYKD